MTKTKLQESIEAISEAQVAYEKAVTDAMAPGLQYIADNYGKSLGSITILGWTPGFNDGEPCEHTTDVMYGYNELYNYGLEYLLEDWFTEEEIENLPDTWHVADEVKEFVSKSLEPYFEKKHGTDYRVTIIFGEGIYKIDEGEYDCGY